MFWSPTSWQSKPVSQQPEYRDAAALQRVLDELACMPPLVTSWEIEALKSQLADAARGERFLLQGGDCCETFDECRPDAITSKLKILLQMSLVLVHGTHKPVIRVGRFAGQYAKPRTSEYEEREARELVARLSPSLKGRESGGGSKRTRTQQPSLSPSPPPSREGENRSAPVRLPSYRGDLVNRIEFTPEAREADPVNLLRAYSRSALTLNFIRALIDGGFADLHHPEYWDLGFVRDAGLAPTRAAEYQRIVEEIGQSLRFMETLAGQTVGEMTRVNFYTSHEALHLSYEQAQTRQVPRRDGWYNLGTHFPWIGVRTADPDGAHVEYMRGIRNPIAIKIGPAPPQEKESETKRRIQRLIEMLNPDNEPGRLTFIHRFGAKEIARQLPVVIEAVRQTEASRHQGLKASGGAPSVPGCLDASMPCPILFVCDPMHGNTHLANVGGSVGGGRGGGGIKTRAFEDILSELEQAFEIHRACGSRLGGVHFELTGENVTECTGGARNVSEADLSRAYKSQVDPRLNYEQALEMAMRIAKKAV